MHHLCNKDAKHMSQDRPRFLALLTGAAVVFLVAYLWGILTLRNQIPPYNLLRAIYYKTSPEPERVPSEPAEAAPAASVPPKTEPSTAEPMKIDLSSVSIDHQAIKRSFAEARQKREILKRAVVAPASAVTLESTDAAGRGTLVATLYDVRVTGILTRSGKPQTSCLRIYIQGHDGDPFRQDYHTALLEKFTGNGCDVLSMSMLGLGLNEGHAGFPTRFGHLVLDETQAANHGNYSFFHDDRNPHLDPLSLFISPHLYLINSLVPDYKDIAILGISGGGWYASFLAALIPEIGTSISYAGSLPFEYRKFTANQGDWEQVFSGIYRDITYWDIYHFATLDGNLAPTRKAVLVYNSKDPCCFPNPYAGHFRDAVDSLSIGNLYVIIDESETHTIRPEVVESVLQQISRPQVPAADMRSPKAAPP
jgi:hypothetical protein